jgi:ABC-2 type transport system ATP-binding protein
LYITRLKDVQNRLVWELPLGWRQRLAIGCALLHHPKILFLDEPTSGVDPITRRHFWKFLGQLSEQGVTVFVTTHYMEEAKNCHHIVLINEGKIVADAAPAEIIAETCPNIPSANLNDAFINLMSGRNY